MDKYSKLQAIANGINAAGKINDIYKSNLQSDTRTVIKAARLSTISDIIGVIASNTTGMSRDVLQETLSKSNLYSNTYRSLKQQFSMSRDSGMNSEGIVRTLGIMMPVLNNQQKVLVDKLVKIYQIIKST